MTSVVTNSFDVQIAGPAPGSSSVLAQAAAAMTAGSWVQLSANNISIIVTNTNGVGGNSIPFSNQAAWDPITKAIRYVGQDHGGSGAFRDHEYIDATNSWGLRPTVPPNVTHGYGHNAVRPDTGDHYYRGNGAVAVAPENTERRRSGILNWELFTASPPTYNQIGIGCAWWSGSLSGTQAAGAYFMWETSFGVIMLYDPIADSWRQVTGISTPGDTYHTVAAYSKVNNCVVFGGGNNQTRNLWKLNSDLSVTVMNAPQINLGIQQGNLQCDPVTGKFLLWGGGVAQFWELDPNGNGGLGSYIQLTGSRQPPPAGLNGVSDPATGGGGPDALISCPIPDYGVVAYISASGASYANMFLYKHA